MTAAGHAGDASNDAADEPAAPQTRFMTIPKVIVSEPPSPEGMADDENKETTRNGGISPKFDNENDEDCSIDGSLLHSGMNAELDFSSLSINYLNDQGTGLAAELMPHPPDGGYGWVVVAAAFVSNLIVDGICTSFAEFKLSFKTYFNASDAFTALIGSLLIGAYLLVGPIVGGLVNKYGNQKVVISGAFLAGFAFCLSTIAPSILIFMFLYGFIGGIGYGMVYLPGIVVVGYYFESKRAMATGIAVAGSGVGTIVMPIVSEFLIAKIGWQGALGVFGVLNMFCAACGAFYRPLPMKPIEEKPPVDNDMEMLKRKLQQYDDDDEEDEGVDEDPSRPDSRAEDGGPPKKTFHRNARTSEWVDVSDQSKVDENPEDPAMVRLRSALSECEPESEGTATPPVGRPPLSPISETNGSFKQRAATTTANPAPPQMNNNRESVRSRKLTLTSMNSELLSTTDLKSRTSSRANLNGQLGRVSARSFAQSLSRLSNKGGQSSLSIAMSGVDPQEFAKPMNRKDIFYGGSIRNLKEFQEEGGNIQNYRESVLSIPASVVGTAATKLTTPGDLVDNRLGESRISRYTGGLGQDEMNDLDGYYDDSKYKFIPLAIRNAFNEMIDVELLKDPVMMLLCLSNLLGMMGFYIPFVFLKDLATSNGVEAGSSRYLVPIIGVTNTVGRVFFGFLADRGYVSALAINNFALIACGVLTFLCPLAPSFGGLATYGALFGFLISAYICLTSIVLADLLGLERLTNSFGLLVVARGIASLLGSPFAGMVYDVTKSYSAAFIFAGIVIAISGVISCTIPFIDKWRRSQGDNEGDAEKAAQQEEDNVSGKLSVLTERSEENLTEYQRTIQSLRQQHALLQEIEEEKRKQKMHGERRDTIGEVNEDDGEEADQTTALISSPDSAETPKS